MASPASPTAQPSAKWYRAILVRAAVILVVLALVVFFCGQALNITSSIQGRPFHDALDLFSTTIPDGWTVKGGKSSNNAVCSGGCSTTGEYYIFQDHQPGNTNATVTIDVTALNNAYARATYCVPVRIPATFVDGIPASTTPQFNPFTSVNPTVPIGTEYYFDSGNAYFSVLIAVGIESMALSPESATPVPTLTDPGSTQDQAQGIRDSIRVTDHLPC